MRQRACAHLVRPLPLPPRTQHTHPSFLSLAFRRPLAILSATRLGAWSNAPHASLQHQYPQQQQQQLAFYCSSAASVTARAPSSSLSSASASSAGVFAASSFKAPSRSVAASGNERRMSKRGRERTEEDTAHHHDKGEEGEENEEEHGGAAPAARLSKGQLHRLVSARLAIPVPSAAYVLEQAKAGATVPFLARYRQDETGHLHEDQIRAVMATAEEVAEVHRRRQFMLTSLEQRGLLTGERRAALEAMAHVSQLEDFWEPFKLKKTSLASRARDAGLGPLAEALLHGTEPLPPTARQTITHVEDGERLFIALLAEELQRCESVRKEILAYLRQSGYVTSSLVKNARKKAAKDMRESDFEQLKKKFAYYDEKRWPVRYLNSHTVLALQRGEAKGVLKVDLVGGEHTPHIFRKLIKQHFPGVDARLQSYNKTNNGGSGKLYTRYESDFLRDSLQAACDHTVKATTNTIRRDLKKSAEREAIVVFAHNLRHLLLQRPLSHARVLAMDPGVTNGVKCVALDESGDVIAFFKCTLMDEHCMREYVAKIVESKRLNKIVIGNGTASQQTARLVADVIKRQKWQHVEFAVVSEAGASVYSVSDTAKEEFPTLDIMYRGAVSIGRRVLDPLSELVKVPVRSMGIGMYQHDVNEKELLTELGHVVESCVASVGVNSTSTNRYVMEKVPGVQKKLVDQIVLSRHSKKLNSREELRRVPGMTESVFNLVAGFFRFPNSPEPLDNTNIHPESYGLMRRLSQLYDAGGLGPSAEAVAMEKKTDADGAAHRRRVGRAVVGLPEAVLRDTARTLGCGVETLRLVGRELLSPALDPRASLPHAGLLRKEIKEAKDLRPGDTLVGVVQSITTFGAFVDCGFHDSVLVRGSEVVDRLQVGALLEGIVFLSLDHLGRPQVRYTPLPLPSSIAAAAGNNTHGGHGSGHGPRGVLRLEADDVIGGGGINDGNGDNGALPSVKLSEQLARSAAAAAREEMEKKESAETTANTSAAPLSSGDAAAPAATTATSLKRAREVAVAVNEKETVEEENAVKTAAKQRVDDDEDDIPFAKLFKAEGTKAAPAGVSDRAATSSFTAFASPSETLSTSSSDGECSSASSRGPKTERPRRGRKVMRVSKKATAPVKRKKSPTRSARSGERSTATATAAKQPSPPPATPVHVIEEIEL